MNEGKELNEQKRPSNWVEAGNDLVKWLWRTWYGRAIVIVVALATAVYLVAAYYPKVAQFFGTGRAATQPVAAASEPLKVAIFYPNPNAEGGAARDGAIQARGIRQAVEYYRDSHPDYPAPREENFTLPLSPNADLFPRIQRAYDEGYRIFVVTMSSAMFHLQQRFTAWYRELEAQGKPLPVLIGTVASAPDLANSSGGVYRLYIRSEEEAEELARYASWKSQVDYVGAFLITHDPNARTDRYGQGGFQTFEHEFRHLGGTTGEFKVTDKNSNADQRVREFMAAAKGKRAGVFIVGYGSMLRDTIEALARHGYQGPIFCASTLTEPTWQPVTTALDPDIVTVTPHRDDPVSPNDDEHGVVFFFTKLTLLRVFRCATEAKDTREFQHLWQQESKQDSIEILHLANGDAIVPVAVTHDWRAARGD